MRTKLITPPEDLPVKLEEMIAHLRAPETTLDEEVEGFIRAATEAVEHKLGRALMTQTWEATLDAFDVAYCDDADASIELPFPPLQSVTAITYVDGSGVVQTLDSAAYVVDTSGLVGRVILAYGGAWPTVRSQSNAVTIQYIAGYQTMNDVPAAIKSWIKLFVEAADKNRGLVHEREAFLSPFAEGLLDRYRVPSI